MNKNTESNNIILNLSSIRKSYEKVTVLDNFHLSVARGEILGIMGRSGSGKSTLLRLIAGLERPDQGEIFLEGKLISSPARILPPYRRKMGMVFQSHALWPHLTVIQHLEYGLSGINKESRRQKVQEMMAYLQLEELAVRYPSQLSGGERQRVALGRALVVKPLILLCDEPFNSFDQQLREEVRKFFYKVIQAEGITTIFVSHDHADLEETDRIFRIEKQV
jgi:ABC-type Fe3+/spermidine/putrescine transport system ATPase subunit